MAEDHIVVGPPGCGKTRWISKFVERTAEKYGADRCLVVSLTRAAAKEAAGRVALSKNCVGTLHSHCFRALGQPKMVDGKAINAWNEEHPDWELSGGARSGDDDAPDVPSVEDTAGDKLLAEVERSRHMMIPMPARAARFAEAWEDHKAQANLIDFTDMIERSYREVPLPPNSPSTIMVDEAQDLSTLELALLRRWSAHVEHFALVGDPNQSIYHWRHASDELSRSTPTMVLGQSYRVPRAVQEAAVRLARRSSTYLDAEYRPRDEVGSVTRLNIAHQDADRILEGAIRLNGDVMVLASCGYMLHPLIHALRSRGIPYHNPFRADSTWNPLMRGTERKRTIVDRVEAWFTMCGFMSGDDVIPQPWQVQLVAKMLLRSGVLSTAEERISQMPVSPELREMLHVCKSQFTVEAQQAMGAYDLEWLVKNSKATVRRALEYPIRVLNKYGMDGLTSKPEIIIGTIHSVKGGEADHVILAPDLSVRGYADFRRPGWAHQDGVLRMFYVGMTRAKKSLRILHRGLGLWGVDLG